MGVTTEYYKENNASQNCEFVIILEGNDDVYFISKLMPILEADPNRVGLVQVEGNNNFQERLVLFFKNPSITQGKTKSVAIICDSDNNPEEIENKIHEALKRANQPTPHSGSHILNEKGTKIGFFTLPSPGDCGDLEKLCLDSVKDNPLEVASEKYINTAEQIANGRMNGSRHKRKAQVYLGGMPKSLSRGAGKAFYDGHFDANHEALIPLRNFLKNTISQ